MVKKCWVAFCYAGLQTIVGSVSDCRAEGRKFKSQLGLIVLLSLIILIDLEIIF